MPKEVLHTILAKFRVRYKNAVDKKHKGTILTEFCETFDYSRKHAMTLLRKPPNKLPGGSGPPLKYGPSVVIHLRNLWEATGRTCSVRLKAAIPIWLDYYTDPSCDTEIAKLLCEISPSTIDRLLRPYRRALKGKSSTQPSAYLKNKIPMESFFDSLKTELFEDKYFRNYEEARKAIFEWIEIFYHRQRIHSGIGYEIPACYAEKIMAKAALTMAFKLAKCAEKNWRKLKGHTLMADVINVKFKFEDGIKVEVKAA